MSIERLGPLDPTSQYDKNQKASKVDSNPARDSISVSEEAKARAEILKALEESHASSDVREDRIAEVKEKLKDSSYINDTIIDEVAEKILNMFDI